MICRVFTQMGCGFVVGGLAILAFAQEEPPAKAIQDNSFLVEEAYNQEPGVVQHIFTAQYSRGGGERAWDLAFTQEWPLFSQQHQLSYTVPYSFIRGDGQWENGPSDVLLNYRFQALFENDRIPAFAPRLSLILPTGDADKDLGNDTVGWQINLPFSKVVSDRWTVNANAGTTILPDVKGHDLWNYNLGGSVIYAVRRDLNLMLECVANFNAEIVTPLGIERRAEVIFSPGLRYAWNFSSGAQMVVGVGAPIGLTRDAADYGVFLYFSFEHAFVAGEGDKAAR